MRKRTGSIDITRDGKHRVRVTLDDGTRKPIGVYETRAEADDARAAAVDVLEKEAPAIGGMTLRVYGEKFLTRREVNAEVVDASGDWGKWRTHIGNEPIAKMALRAIKTSHVRECIAKVRRGRAKQTAQNVLNLLRVIFKSAREADAIKSNPCDGLTLPKQKRTHEPWTFAIPEEQAKLIESAPRSADIIVAAAIWTGLRAGELVTLHLVDVHADIDDAHIVVRYGGRDDEVELKATKGGRLRRVPLLGPMANAIRTWIANGLPAYAKSNPHGLLFPRERGGYRDENHVIRWDEWQATKTRAGITRRFRWHDLRHTCASSLVSGWWGRAWTLEEVKEMLGHRSITTTERYAHLAGDVLSRAAKGTPNQSAHNWPAMPQVGETTSAMTPGQRLPKPKVSQVRVLPGAPIDSPGYANNRVDAKGRLRADSSPPPKLSGPSASSPLQRGVGSALHLAKDAALAGDETITHAEMFRAARLLGLGKRGAS